MNVIENEVMALVRAVAKDFHLEGKGGKKPMLPAEDLSAVIAQLQTADQTLADASAARQAVVDAATATNDATASRIAAQQTQLDADRAAAAQVAASQQAAETADAAARAAVQQAIAALQNLLNPAPTNPEPPAP